MRGIEAVAPQTRSRAFLAGAGVVLLFLAAQLVATYAAYGLGVRFQLNPIGTEDALQLAAVKAFEALAAFFVIFGSVGSRDAALLGGWRDNLHAFGALAPVLLVFVGIGVGVAVWDGDVLHPSMDMGLACAVVVLALAISAAEEVWFRGLLIARLQRAGSPTFTVGASAVLFGLPHALAGSSASVVNAVAVTLAVGIPFAVVRLAYPALGALIVVHALVDSWAFLHTAGVTPAGDPTLRETLTGLILPALVAWGYVAWLRMRVRVV